MSMTYANLNASADARAWADSAAKNAYQSAMMNNASASQALQSAMFEWQKTMDRAAMTGKWEGQWSNPQEQWFTGQFGQWYGAGGEPGVGTQTLQAQQTQGQLAQNWSQMFGQYYAPGTAPTQGAQTFEAQQAALDQANKLATLYGTAYAPGQQAAAGTLTQTEQQRRFEDQMAQQKYYSDLAQQQQQNAQSYLGILSNLRGPADWAKYQQVLGSTPGGMRDLYAAAMGQYTPGGGATTGYQPQAVDLNTMQQQIAGYGGYGQQGGQAWAQQPNNMMQYGLQQPAQQFTTGYYNQPAGQQAPTGNEQWGSGIGIGGNQATPAQAVQATGNGTNMYGGQQQQYNLPAPNQIAAQSWNNFTPSQQQMMLGIYEGQGYDKNDVQALYNQSLPKYAQNTGAGTWRLR